MVVAVVAVYVPAMGGGFIWDDDRYVTTNDALRTAGGLGAIWFDIGETIQYYPLVFSTFWVEYQLWGLEPFGYHLINVLLHAASAVLLWFALRRLSVPGAWLAAAVFALHPVQVESVAWITERKNVLSGLFYMAALLCYLRFEPAGGRELAGPRRWRYYGLALALFFCALLSKTVTCSLPAVILLLLWWKRDRLTARNVLPLVPMFALGAVMSVVTVLMEKHNVRAQGADWALSSVERCLIAGRALWFYLAKLIYPAELMFNYPRWEFGAGAWWQYLYPVAAVGVVGGLWFLRRRIGKGPLVAVLFFGGTLLPALGFIDVYPMRYSFVADHFQYLACIGPIVLLVALPAYAWGAGRQGQRPAGGRGGGVEARSVVSYGCSGVLLCVFGALTWQQGGIYQDLDTLWRDTLEKNPSSWIAHNNLGTLLLDRNETGRAARCFAEALRLKPDFYEAHGNMGKALVNQGRIDEGIWHLKEALRIKPNLAWAYNSLGHALARQGRHGEAIENCRLALRLRPDFAEAHNNMANSLVQQGDPGKALDHFERALQLKPDWATAHSNMANALAQQGRYAEAGEHYREAIRLQPDNVFAHRNLGSSLTEQGRTDEAIAAYRQALRYRPGDATVHAWIGGLLRQKGLKDEAMMEFEAALRIQPGHALAMQGMEALSPGWRAPVKETQENDSGEP